MPNKSASTVLDSAQDKVKEEVEELKRDSSQSTTKLERYKIIYNKKAESEFFVDNSALAGFTGERILYMATRELIENSLDSCESFSILPSIKISLKIFDQTNDLWMLACEDNGTGINSDKLPIAVCSFLTSAKYMEKQQRGLFGVGLKMIAAFSTKDTDFPIKVWNKSIDEQDEYYFELRTDIGTNKPIVLSKKMLHKQHSRIQDTSGFRIEVILRAKLVPITKNKIYEYVSETSIVNPYSSITFETDDGIFQFNRRTSIMPNSAQEILPHPSDMDLKTLKKAISKFQTQKMSLPKILSSSFQKLSYEKAKDVVTNTGLSLKTPTGDFSEHDLIKIVNICKKTKFQNPNTDHLSPIGREVLTIGMMSEYTIVSNKGNDSTGVTVAAPSPVEEPILNNADPNPQVINDIVTTSTFESEQNDEPTPPPFKNGLSKSNFSVKVLKPVLTTYTSRTCVINNRPTVVETGLAYGGDIPSFKLYRFANKIPLLYDEGSDVAREVISEVEINKMGITKKQAKEQFSVNKESKKDRVIEVLPLHIFFHICSTKIPYKTAGKESIASEGELKYYMKSCLSELYRKLSTQIRKELKLKEEENKIRLYKHYLPFIVDSINESLGSKNSKLNESFTRLIENHLSKKPQIDIGDVSSADSTLPVQTSQKMDLADIDLNPDIQEAQKTKDVKDVRDIQKTKDVKDVRDIQKTKDVKDVKDIQKTKSMAFSKPNLNKLESKKKDNKKVNPSFAGKLSKVDPTRNVTKNKKPKGTNKKLIIKEKDTTNKKKSLTVKTSVNRAKLNKSFNRSPNQSKTKEVQSTIDSYSKRVNKGKKK